MILRPSRVLAVLCAMALGSVFLAGSSASAATSPDVIARVTDASATGPLVVGIGDSILEGHGLDAGESWLAVLALQNGWRLTNLASDGSGFVAVGDNGDTFADQVRAAVELHPDMVVISGSSNDLGDDDKSIQTATTATIDAIHSALPATTIIAVSAFWGDTEVPVQLDDISSYVKEATIADGGSYVDIGQPLSGEAGLMQADDDHPTAEGQLLIASAVSSALVGAGINLAAPGTPAVFRPRPGEYRRIAPRYEWAGSTVVEVDSSHAIPLA